jgi:hypothetical protein
MKTTFKLALLAAAFTALSGSAIAQQKNAPLQTGEPMRPMDAGANKPSESGAQSTTRSGAATGAGQAQGAGEVTGAGSAKAKTQADTGSGNEKLAKQKTTKKKAKRKHKKAKRSTDGTADSAGASSR